MVGWMPSPRTIQRRSTPTTICPKATRERPRSGMTPVMRPTDQPAHLRLVSDRAGAGAPEITLSGVSKTYRTRDGEVPSLRPLDFRINEGEFFVVVGPSGCGKSTLLKLISGLLAPT